MTPKAISFTPEVLKAKLRALEEHGRCQTRRPVRTNAPSRRAVTRVSALMDDGRAWVEPGGWVKPPFGLAGQSLWVRERAIVIERDCPIVADDATDDAKWRIRVRYASDGVESAWLGWPRRLEWWPMVGYCIPNGVHREGARHFLEVLDVRAERVSEISEEDAVLEGMSPQVMDPVPVMAPTAREQFFAIYDTIYGESTHFWHWCWVYTLKRAAP